MKKNNFKAVTTASQIIDSLGGTCAVSAKTGLSPQAISRWRVNGIPKAWMRLIVLGGLSDNKKLDKDV